MTDEQIATHNQLVDALRKVLRDDSPDAPMLIKRVPFICEDIRQINEKIKDFPTIKNDLRWIKILFGGFATTVGGGLAFAIFQHLI